MARYHSPDEYLKEARSPETSSERLDALARTEWEFVRAAVAAHPNTAARTLAELMPVGAREIDESIAVAIARRVEASPEMLRKLADRFGKAVNFRGRAIGFELGLALLGNPATPDDAVTWLVDPERSSRHFRERAASTSRVPGVLARLNRDISERVRKRAENSLKIVEEENVQLK